MKRLTDLSRLALVCFLPLTLTCCGGGGGSGTENTGNGQTSQGGSGSPPPSHLISISGNVTGLRSSGAVPTGDQFTIQIAAGTSKVTPIYNNGAFSLPDFMSSGTPFDVTVISSPVGQNCTVTNGSSNGNDNLTNVLVSCTNVAYPIGVNVSGLPAGQQFAVSNNGIDLAEVTGNGMFYFPIMVAVGGSYDVKILLLEGQYGCSVLNGVGIMGLASATNINIVCSSNELSVGGNLYGLTSAPLVLLNNNLDPITLEYDGAFFFQTSLPIASTYSVTVGQQPFGQNCVVGNGAGTIGESTVVDISVTCSTVPQAAPAYNSTQPPVLSTLSPASTDIGCASVNLGVNGTNFSPLASVLWNGQAIPTTFVSTTRLTATIPASYLASVGTSEITVSNGASGSISNQMNFATTNTLADLDSTDTYTNPAHTQFTSLACPINFPSAPTWTARIAQIPQIVLIAEGKVFVSYSVAGANNSYLLALNLGDGSTAWGPIELKGDSPAIAYDNGQIFVAMGSYQPSDGNFRAYDASSGKLNWKVDINENITDAGSQTKLGLQLNCNCGVSAANGTAYASAAPGNGGVLYAFQESNGSFVQSSQPIPIASGAQGPPAIGPDAIFLTQTARTLSFDRKTLALLWSRGPGGYGGFEGWAVPIVAGNNLYSPELQAYSQGGQTYNEQNGAPTGTYVSNYLPSIGDQTGFFMIENPTTGYGILRAIDLASGNEIWRYAGDGYLINSPIATKHYTFVESRSGYIFAIDSVTGEQVWEASVGQQWSIVGLGNPSATGLTVGDGMVIVPVSNTLTAFNLH